MHTMEYQLKQNQMIKYQLEHRGITDKRVLDAFMKVPRHEFVDPFFRNVAYDDNPLSIGEGQTISQPYVVAFMTESLDIKPSEKILEVGTGSGFQAAILAHLSNSVHTIETIDVLHHKAKRNLESQGLDHVNTALGDGKEGLKSEAPFDKIIVTAATKDVPTPLLEQLKIGGQLIIPLDSHLNQELTLITKKENQKCTREPLLNCRFVRLL